ncbi:hypothetical protein PSTT_07459 [Puccinia striiformis]|uniref:Uncharacterized protein n=1 Tax=Puccinia striiformis TaxID=27350 RepID=A0A2S4VGF0_9BASI|nr:hypothetical protein PSTT_07459 [Puccinia striiformis]
MDSSYPHTSAAFLPSQEAASPKSSLAGPRVSRSRSTSHPIKIVFLTAKKAIQHQFSNPNQPTPAQQATMLPSTLKSPDLDDICKTSDGLRFKSTLFSCPSSPEVSVGHVSGQLLELVCPLQNPHPETTTMRLTRPNVIDLDLMDETPLRIKTSSLPTQTARKSSHRRRWTTQRSKDTPHDTNNIEPFNLTFINEQALALSPNARSGSGSSRTRPILNEFQDRYHSDESSNSDSSSFQSFQFVNHDNIASSQLIAPRSFENPIYDSQDSLDIEDLTTPTLKSCERFQDDNSITPCQTFSTPNLKNPNQRMCMTPRMIYEDYQRKFNQEDIIIRSRDSHSSPRQFTNREDEHIADDNQTFYDATDGSDADMSSAVALHHMVLNSSDAPLEDSSDESFESFGDDEMFGSLLRNKSSPNRKPGFPLNGVFPLPPAARTPSYPPSNVPRTPSPKQGMGKSSKNSTPESIVPRKLTDGDDRALRQSKSSSPLALGKPIVAKPLHPRPVNSHEKALFQLQPSPYRHVERESAVHEGPDHLESSTRLMQMFDSFLERSPKRNGANVSAGSLTRKSMRKLKLEESPLKKFSILHFPETPELIVQFKRPGARDSHRTPLTVAHNQRPSGPVSGVSTKPKLGANVRSVEADFNPPVTSLPNIGSLLPPQDCFPPASAKGTGNLLHHRDEHASPASDSDDEPGQSPKTPFGSFFNPSNQPQPCVPRYGRMLSDEGLAQKIVFKQDSYSPPTSQSLSLEVLEEDEHIHRSSKLGHPTDPRENRTAPEHHHKNQTHASHAPWLKHRGSIAKISSMADGILSIFTSQKHPKEFLHIGGLTGSSDRDNSVDNESSSSTEEGFDSPPHKSTWSSILEQDFGQSKSNPLLNSVNASRQKASRGKTVSGRILFEELNHELGHYQQPTGRNNEARMNHTDSLINIRPHYKNAGPFTYDTCTPSRSGSLQDVEFQKEHGIIIEAICGVTEDVSTEVQQILSPIRLYGKQQGVLETGNWKTNNLNFQSMVSQYKVTASNSKTSENMVRATEVVNLSAVTARSRDRALTEETHQPRAGRIPEGEEEEAEKEKKESLMVYKIQEEDDNQILTFEMNRLKRIFHNKALKSSKSKSKISSKPLANLFNH